jgi:hypothetical protein
MAPRHAGVDAGLIDEEQIGRIDRRRIDAPRVPRGGDVGALLLGSVTGLFLRRQPSCWSARQIADRLRL